ncbi:DUF421 domain-containing protein [Bacillus marinisedimentorum]|uniref:DUF421 domain-containing protein n=1 Tax=Bacillus marinisedimentorum TaxID=1821260 RepID=UPI0007DE5CAB|nr:YetF domain-containing protein [Bacillus marinisedimentorum]
MFFDTWTDIGRLVIVSILAYFALVFLLRISGKRTLSKMNAFDLVVTVAIGSTLATILLNKKVSIAEGLTAFAMLIGLQYIVAWLSVRSKTVGNLIKDEPQLLYYGGIYIRDAMKKERILDVEILQAARTQGVDSMKKVEAVVLETDGSISIIKKSDKTGKSTLDNVEGAR